MKCDLSFFDMVNNCKGNYKIAFRFFDKEKITFDTFYHDCCVMQNEIMNCKGDFVGIYLPYSYEWIISYFGIQLAGKTAVLIDDSITQYKLNHICKTYSISEVITNKSNNQRRNNTTAFLKKVENGAKISTIIFTSGTEGDAKGVALSERGIISSTFDSVNTLKIKNDDIVMHTLPFYHGFGLAAEVVATILKQTTLCFGKNLGSIPNDITDFSATTMFCVPQVAKGLAPYLKSDTSLKKIIMGSADIDIKLIDYLQNIGITVHSSYGLSECSPVVAVSAPLDIQSSNYAGRILQCCRVQIESDGEICVMGKNLMLGYYDGKILDFQTKDGFFHTGDIGYLNGDKLYVTGRKKAIMVFSNGEKVSLNVLEDKIAQKCNFSDCFIFPENNEKINIIIYSPQSTVLSKGLIKDCLPIGVSVANCYRSETPIIVNKMNKKVRNIEIQLKKAHQID